MDATTPSGERYRIDEYFGLFDLGLIDPDERSELLSGLVVSMAPQQPLHAAVAANLDRLIQFRLRDAAGVRVQLPLVLGDDSVPEPDIALVAPRADFYAHAHPTTAIVVIEIADTSLGQDRLTKSRIYAASGIPTYWIVNLRARTVEWYRSPDREAKLYAQTGTASEGELVCPELPSLHLRIAEIFPAA